jgi:hypothetical protein
MSGGWRNPSGAVRIARSRVVHGWAFRDFTPAEVAAIREYIATGDTLPDFPEMYRKNVERLNSR